MPQIYKIIMTNKSFGSQKGKKVLTSGFLKNVWIFQNAYLLAANAMERERLKQQFAFKYLLRASGGSNDQNREGEVGNGVDDDEGRGLKR